MAEIIHIGNGLAADALAGACCAFGVFDGVHKGHQFLIGCARMDAAEAGTRSAVLTFSIDPDELFAPDRLVKLMTNEERIRALAATGIDVVAVLSFDRAFAALSPTDFLETSFWANPPLAIHVGEGFRFGSKGSGDECVLAEWGDARGMSVHVHQLLDMEGMPVSATRIRGLLCDGRQLEAERLLGHGLSGFRSVKAVGSGL